MNISITETTAESFELLELRERAVLSSKSPKTKHYRVEVDSKEAAFLSLDRWPEPDYSQLVIYEIFVSQTMRMKGVATAILKEVEQIAIKEGFQKLHLRPSPLESEMPKGILENWYIRRGFSWDPVITGDMEKPVSPES